jgi:hypothetical protein
MVKDILVDNLPRLTVTLGRGQKETLQAIADRNHTTLAFLIRYALDRFIMEHQQEQFRLKM